MSSQLNEQFYSMVAKDPEIAKLKKFWTVQESFSTKSPHMLFIIKYFVIKKIYAMHQARPNNYYKDFMKGLAIELGTLKKQIPGNDHDAKIERIRQSVLSFFGNCQNSYDQGLFSASLAQK
jgi:hypothetical protein